MLILWRKEIIRLRARIIKNILATISITVMFSACGGSGSDNENTINEDSLKQVREQERLDSIARVDSIAMADSIARADSIAYEDSVKNAQHTVPVNPVLDPPDYPQTEYGVVFPYDEPDYPVNKYGVQIDID
ncbi:MAG: hypothetical protein JXR53_09805 [Bacteroidales bacterium]|nr:hypothetical protein [Bacteroidales bacterium]